MQDVITLTRTLNIYYHHLHNIAHGESFVGDHSLMSDFYKQMSETYDQLIERFIGLGNEYGKDKLLEIVTDFHAVLDSIPEGDDMDVHFQYSMYLESSLQAELAAACEMATKGTENLLAALADESEQRVYQLKQRCR